MIAHLTLATRDAARSCKFFNKALGWKPINRPGNVEMKSAWLRIPPAHELHLVQSPDFEPSPFEEEYGRHIALEYPLEQFDELRERLVENGAELIEPRRERTHDDLTSELILSQDADGCLRDDERMAISILLIGAGRETTAQSDAARPDRPAALDGAITKDGCDGIFRLRSQIRMCRAGAKQRCARGSPAHQGKIAGSR